MNEYYRVIRHKSSTFEVDYNGQPCHVKALGKLRRDGEILVGDYVSLADKDGEKVIHSVKKRVNSLIRPSVANVDLIVLVVAPQPQIDWFLIDKMIINCKQKDIDCVICLNKNDLDDSVYGELVEQYADDVAAVVAVSAINNEISSLLPLLDGKLVCFAGQSAVGKSTLSNAIMGGNVMLTGELSEKIGRGKNTTTSAALLKSPSGCYFIDTPGFSMLDAMEEDYSALASYYDGYVAFADECKFHPCTHTTEPDCAVKRAVADGKLSGARYDRYVKIFEESKEAYKRRR